MTHIPKRNRFTLLKNPKPESDSMAGYKVSMSGEYLVLGRLDDSGEHLTERALSISLIMRTTLKQHRQLLARRLRHTGCLLGICSELNSLGAIPILVNTIQSVLSERTSSNP